MARRVSWTNNSSGHSGTYVYRAPTLDPLNLPAPVATVGPAAQGATAEWVDNDELAAGDYDYAVQDFDGQGVGALSALSTYTLEPTLNSAQAGDYLEGGVYAGIKNIGGSNYHIISATQAGEEFGLLWGNSGIFTGANSLSDGFANQQEVLNNHDNGDSESFYHARDYFGGGYADWYIPARYELEFVMDQLGTHSEFSDNAASGDYTQTSSEDGSYYAYGVAASGTYSKYGTDKDGRTSYVRPIRKVAV